MEERNFRVVGGDIRQKALAELLREDGHTVHISCLAEEGIIPIPLDGELKLAHCILLPLPVTDGKGNLHTPLWQEKIPLAELLNWLEPGQILCGGMVTQPVRELLEGRGLRVFDYYAREECMVANAVPTAEGAVQLAMEQLPFTLHGARVLVLGFGRVGKLTAHRMGALGARVTVSAGDYAELAWAQAYGHDIIPLQELDWALGGFQLIVNTIPARVLDERRLQYISREALMLDVASSPGGADPEAARALGLHLITAPGLPGRTAPVTAAAAIRDAVYHILRELEE